MTDKEILLLYNVFISNVNDIIIKGKYLYIQGESNVLFSNDNTNDLSPWYMNHFKESHEKSHGFLFPMLLRHYYDKYAYHIIDGNHRYAYVKKTNKIILAIDLAVDVMEITVPRHLIQDEDIYEVINIFYIDDIVFVRLNTHHFTTFSSLYLRFVNYLKELIDESGIVITASKMVNLNVNKFINGSNSNNISIRNREYLENGIVEYNHVLESVNREKASLLYRAYVYNLRQLPEKYEKLSNISNNIITKEIWDDVKFSKDSLIGDISKYGLYMPISYNESSSGNTICDGVHRWHAIKSMDKSKVGDFYFLTVSTATDLENYSMIVPNDIFDEYIYLCKKYNIYLKDKEWYLLNKVDKHTYDLLQSALDLEIGNLINSGVFYKYGIEPDSYVYGRINN